MTIQLNPNYALGETVAGLREFLYKTFLDPVIDNEYSRIILVDASKEPRYLVGYVEDFDAEIFASENQVQISMLCPDPFIRSNFSVELENISGWTTVPFVYEGTAKTGFTTRIRIIAPTSVLTLQNNTKAMIINHDFLVNDIIEIDTRRGIRSITLTRGSPVVTSSLLAKLTPTSPWLELQSQKNQLRVYGASSASLPAVATYLSYNETFWGV
jgi:phage-related protein